MNPPRASKSSGILGGRGVGSRRLLNDGRWRNAANIGVSEAEIVALWNETYPEDPIEM